MLANAPLKRDYTSYKVIRRRKDGKRLSNHVFLKHKVQSLFYSFDKQDRQNKIPQWYHQFVRLPNYYFRIKGSTMSPKQVVASTLARLYYSYRFVWKPLPGSINLNIKINRSDRIARLIPYLQSRGWYTVASIIYRRLKVLLCSV